jgi:predicted ATP-grasp superfamily ATP-dependent carboligase
LRLPDPRTSTRAFQQRLQELVAGGAYAVLLPGTEASLVAVSEVRARLEPHTRLGLPPQEAVDRSIDKVALLEAAAAAGLEAPASAVCASDEEAQVAASELGFPVIVKPVRSLLREDGSLRHRNAAVASDARALEAALPSFGTRFVVQRYDGSGAVLSCSGVATREGVVALALARYRRTWPPGAGPSCFSETLTPPPALVRSIEELLRSLGWEGIFQVQLLERGGGRFATLDFNPRVFGSLALPVRAGANLPAFWCDWLLGRRPSRVTARAGVRYRWEEGDLRHLLWQLRRRRFRAAAAVLRPQRRVAHAYFKLDDPAPLAARALAVGTKLVRRSR